MIQFLIFFLLLVSLLIYNKIIDLLNIKLVAHHKINWYKFAFLSRKHLVELSIGDFEDWCVNFLERQNYKHVTIAATWNDSMYKTITCLKSEQATYVYCKQTKEIDEQEDDFEKFEKPQLQKFVGTLEHDHISNGVIITTGNFTFEASEYAQNLPKRISLQLFDGITITKEHRKLREKEVTLHLQQENNLGGQLNGF